MPDPNIPPPFSYVAVAGMDSFFSPGSLRIPHRPFLESLESIDF